MDFIALLLSCHLPEAFYIKSCIIQKALKCDIRAIFVVIFLLYFRLWLNTYLENVLTQHLYPTIPMTKETFYLPTKFLHLTWILARNSTLTQTIPSWTGFNIILRKDISVSKSLVGYLHCLDAPATAFPQQFINY